MSFERQMYEVKEKWEESYFSDSDRRRIEFISNLIPAEAASLLDVGCGNGILVNYLMHKYKNKYSRICATDRSETSLQFVKSEKYQSDIDLLLFNNGEFDVVTCLEVIEHLPIEVYQNALRELERVAAKYVIISVPFNEDLDVSKVTCIKCRTEFSPFYHMRSFDEEALSNLFNQTSLQLISVHPIEMLVKPAYPKIKKMISRFLHPEVFPPNCICPMCGYNEFAKLKPGRPAVAEHEEAKPASKGLSRFWPHHKEAKWLVALFSK